MSLLPDDLFGPERPLVLVATTDGPTRIALARTITLLGLTPLIALDDTTALAAAQEYARDLVGAVLDAHLPTLAGWEVALALRSTFADLPLAVLSNRVNPDQRLNPVDAVIFPPADRVALVAYLDGLAVTVDVA